MHVNLLPASLNRVATNMGEQHWVNLQTLDSSIPQEQILPIMSHNTQKFSPLQQSEQG